MADSIGKAELSAFKAALDEVAKQGDVGHLLQLHNDLAEAGASEKVKGAVSSALVETIGNIAASANDNHTGIMELLVGQLTGKSGPNEAELAPLAERFQPGLHPLHPDVYIKGMKLMAASKSMNFVPYIARILDKRNLESEVHIKGMELLNEKEAFEEIEAILERDASEENYGDIRYEEREKILGKLVEIELHDIPDEDEKYGELFSKILWQYTSDEIQKRIDNGVISPDADLKEESSKLADWTLPQIKNYLENELATLDNGKSSHPLIEEEVEKKLEKRVEKENLDKSVYLKGMMFLAKGKRFRVLADMHTRTDVSSEVKAEAIRLLKKHRKHLSSKEVLSSVLSKLKNRPNKPKKQDAEKVTSITGPGPNAVN